jgi:hypothetical protein
MRTHYTEHDRARNESLTRLPIAESKVCCPLASAYDDRPMT